MYKKEKKNTGQALPFHTKNAFNKQSLYHFGIVFCFVTSIFTIIVLWVKKNMKTKYWNFQRIRKKNINLNINTRADYWIFVWIKCPNIVVYMVNFRCGQPMFYDIFFHLHIGDACDFLVKWPCSQPGTIILLQ